MSINTEDNEAQSKSRAQAGSEGSWHGPIIEAGAFPLSVHWGDPRLEMGSRPPLLLLPNY